MFFPFFACSRDSGNDESVNSEKESVHSKDDFFSDVVGTSITTGFIDGNSEVAFNDDDESWAKKEEKVSSLNSPLEVCKIIFDLLT